MFKSTLSLLMLVVTAEAFTQTSVVKTRSAMAMTETGAGDVAQTVIPPKKVAIPAKWLPIGGLKAPLVLDGSLAGKYLRSHFLLFYSVLTCPRTINEGDVGFDPVGFSKSQKTLFWMREAETKHGRLAMLAAVGWPLSELYHKGIAETFGLASILAEGDRAPSLLNGGAQFSSDIIAMIKLITCFRSLKYLCDWDAHHEHHHWWLP